jgi:hypothetical protein
MTGRRKRDQGKQVIPKSLISDGHARVPATLIRNPDTMRPRIAAGTPPNGLTSRRRHGGVLKGGINARVVSPACIYLQIIIVRSVS